MHGSGVILSTVVGNLRVCYKNGNAASIE